MIWVRDYIGIPWKLGGESPEEGFDCWGFFRYIQRKHFKVEVPKVYVPTDDIRAVRLQFKHGGEFKNWEKIDHRKFGSAVLMGTNSKPTHIGTWVNCGKENGVLHCTNSLGVVFTSGCRFKLAISKYRILGYYERNVHKN